MGAGDRCWNRFRYDMYRSAAKILEAMTGSHLHKWLIPLNIGVGVAYSMGPEWAEPKAIQHWPGKIHSELANKVPSRLQYEENSFVVNAWGFLCDVDGDKDNSDLLTCFKLHLDPTFPDPRPGAPSVEDARQWFQDYIRCIHDHILETFTVSFPYWKNLKTEFIFSVPTTWKSPPMIAEIEKLIKAAGYGSGGPNHRAGVGLTEAEAAAVYASKQRFNVRETT